MDTELISKMKIFCNNTFATQISYKGKKLAKEFFIEYFD